MTTEPDNSHPPSDVEGGAMFANAVDSLRMGIRHHLDESLEMRDKWAALALFHSVELFLKERLHREDPALIYRDMGKRPRPDSFTVTLGDALDRLERIDAALSIEARATLQSLQRERNRIEHQMFVPEEALRSVLGKTLKAIRVFLRDHLDGSIEDVLDPAAFAATERLILHYDDLVEKAMFRVERRRPADPNESHPFQVEECPECGEKTLVSGDGEYYCEMCEEHIAAQPCAYCGAASDDMGVCANCLDHRLNKTTGARDLVSPSEELRSDLIEGPPVREE